MSLSEGEVLQKPLLSDVSEPGLPPRRVSLERCVTVPPHHKKLLEKDGEEDIADYRRCSSESPKASKRSYGGPLARRMSRGCSRTMMQFTALPGGSAMSEMMSFPSAPDCAHCHKQLAADEMRYGTGLCDPCYTKCVKDCSICKKRLHKKQLMWGSGLCNRCYDSCNKNCRICTKSLALEQLHWNSGLCDDCYNSCEKTCRMCSQQLEWGQLRWGTGLCDPCYNSVLKDCRICSGRIEERQLRWNSGLCNVCYDRLEKVCSSCNDRIGVGSLHWRTKMCDPCYDNCEKVCKMCHNAIDKQSLVWGTGLCDPCYEKCDKTCAMCKEPINSKQLHWGTGLCDKCYNGCDKVCKMCKDTLHFGTARWGSGLCDKCYDGCERICTICTKPLPLGQLHWGTRLCDTCFDSCDKTCIRCKAQLSLGQLHWGTGLCNKCYDQGRLQRGGLSSGVRAVIGTQFAFYVAPGALQPSLYLQIQEAGLGSPAAVFAAVLMTASFGAMVAPVPLGMWADRRGEREVYVGITAIGAASAVAFLFSSNACFFALAWAGLNMPPAVRGVRAAYFAKNVAPEELSRAGQLASSAGLAGGFLGPLVSVLANQVFGTVSDGRSVDGFFVSACFAALIYAASAFWLAWSLPRPRLQLSRTASGKGHQRSGSDLTPLIQTCDLCDVQLTEDVERKAALSLCNLCYDRFGGENVNFKRYSQFVLGGFCLVSMLLEFSMNAGVIATFQPLAVTYFGWGNDAIAAVNFAGSGLSVVISLLMAQLRLPERVQMALAAGLYFFGVLIYCGPPLSEWRLVVGLMLGIKAQILFMAPFTAIFSRLIGRARVTNRLTTALCLAPAIGAALGTSLAPACVSVAGTMAALLAALPAAIGVSCIAANWRMLDRMPKPGREWEQSLTSETA